MSSTPAITVMIPMKNAGSYIRPTLESILSQTEADFEVVIVNDGSTDDSVAVVESYHDPRIRIVAGPCKGIAASCNCGFEAAHGEFLVRCDSDDLYPPGRLAEQLSWLRSHPEFGAVCGGFCTVTPKGQPVAELVIAGQHEAEITDELKHGVARTHGCTFMMRTDLLRKTGGCRSYFKSGSDLDLQYRLGEVMRVWFIPKNWYTYRLHDASITHTQGKTLREFYEATGKRFARQRLETGQDDLQRGTPPAPPADNDKPSYAGAQIAGQLLSQAWHEHYTGRKMRAIGSGLRALRRAPFNRGYWKSCLALAIKPAGKAGTEY